MEVKKITESKKVTVSSKAEEYLEAIHRQEEKTGSASIMNLARQLKVVPRALES